MSKEVTESVMAKKRPEILGASRLLYQKQTI
jgi:hypothetical protein